MLGLECSAVQSSATSHLCTSLHSNPLVISEKLFSRLAHEVPAQEQKVTRWRGLAEVHVEQDFFSARGQDASCKVTTTHASRSLVHRLTAPQPAVPPSHSSQLACEEPQQQQQQRRQHQQLQQHQPSYCDVDKSRLMPGRALLPRHRTHVHRCAVLTYTTS